MGWILIITTSILSIIAFVFLFFRRHPIIIATETEWAIGIFQGDSCFNLTPAIGIRNPVITRSDVTDVKAEFVSDPFLVQADNKWYLFFEVMNSLAQKGEIGCAASQDSLHWEYNKIVLKEPFHLSYPYVFQYEGRFYIIPESAKASAIRLYVAERFPFSWNFVTNLLLGTYVDTSVFYTNETWWMMTCSKPHTHDELRLFYADRLTGPWTEHPNSPLVIKDPTNARPAGRILLENGKIIRFAQDDRLTYGKNVLAFLITEITRTTYAEQAYDHNPILDAQRKGWNRHGMHHIDPHKVSQCDWIAAVDGYRKQKVLRIEY